MYYAAPYETPYEATGGDLEEVTTHAPSVVVVVTLARGGVPDTRWSGAFLVSVWSRDEGLGMGPGENPSPVFPIPNPQPLIPNPCALEVTPEGRRPRSYSPTVRLSGADAARPPVVSTATATSAAAPACGRDSFTS
jgi:hypothetical protein